MIRKKIRLVAYLASATIHAALIASLLASAAGGITSRTSHPAGPSASSPSTFNVMIVDVAGGVGSAAFKVKPRSVPTSEGVYVAPDESQGLSDLMARLQKTQDARSETAQHMHVPRYSSSSDEHPSPGSSDGDASSTGALWGKVEPCWRGAPGASLTPVTLEVRFNRQGDLAAPPQILRRRDDRLDETRLRAEERAIAAITGCAPRGDLRFAEKLVRLEFGQSNQGRRSN